MSNPSPREATAYAARAALGGASVSVAHLARETGHSHAYWTVRLSGAKAMSVDDLIEVSDATGVPVRNLLRADGAA